MGEVTVHTREGWEGLHSHPGGLQRLRGNHPRPHGRLVSTQEFESFPYVSMDSWIITFYLSYDPTLLYFISQTVPALSVGSRVPLTHSHHLWDFRHLLFKI